MHGQKIENETGMVFHNNDAPHPPYSEHSSRNLNEYESASDLNHKASNNHLSSTLHAVRKKSIIVLHILLDQFIESCQSNILEQVNQLSSTPEQNNLIDANSHLRSNSREFKQQFLQAINRAFIVPIEAGAESKHALLQEDQEKEEGWRQKLLADCKLCTKENHIFLNSLNTRLGYLIEKTHDKQHALNPLSPDHLSYCFEAQVISCEWIPSVEKNHSSAIDSSAIEGIILSTFYRTILNKIAHLYYVIDLLLDSRSIPLAKEINNTLEKEHATLLHHRKNIAILETPQTRDTWIIKDLAQTRETKPLSQYELLTILNIIQAEHYDAFETEIKKTFFQILNKKKKLLGYAGEITHQDTQRIQLAINLFDIALLNPYLNAATKHCISRLITPFIKVAILDPRFLSSSNHIARDLLNKIVSHSLMSQKEIEQKNGAAQFIDTLTLNIINTFHMDLDTFQDAYHLLQSRELEKEALHQKNMQTHLNMHFLGENDCIENNHKNNNPEDKHTEYLNNQQDNEDQQIAEQTAQEAIKEHLARNAHHEYIQHFATMLWQQVLARAALKHGTDSAVWQKHEASLLTVCKLSLPAEGSERMQQRRSDITLTLNAIQRALVECAHNPMQGSEALEILCTLFKEAYRGNRPSMDDLGHITLASGATYAGNNTQVSTEKNTHTQYHQELTQQVRQFSRGAWFDWKVSPLRIIRCRLAAIIKEPERYIFTDREGVKVAELLLDDAVNALYEQKLSPIQDHGVFDQALESVVTGLRERRKD